MKRRNKVLLCIFCVFCLLLLIIYVSIHLFKKYVSEVLFDRVEYLIRYSQVLNNEIGEIDKIELQLFPVFSYKYTYAIYDAKLTYKITTKDKKEYITMVFVNPSYIGESLFDPDRYVHAYQIEDKIIYESVSVYDKDLDGVIVDNIYDEKELK